MMIDVHSPELAHEIKTRIQGIDFNDIIRRTMNEPILWTDCPEDCIFDNYHVSSSSTQLDLGDHDDMHVDEKHDDSVLHTAIHFYYSSFSFTIIKNHPGSLVKWLSKLWYPFFSVLIR